MIVVELDFFVATESPIGDTLVPLESDRFMSVTTPLTLEVRWLLDETEEVTGGGATGDVVDSVVVELEDELCARATPDISVTAIVAASKVLIIVGSPEEFAAGGDRSLFVLGRWHLGGSDGSLGNYLAAPVISSI